jgi:putative membrane protein
MPAFLSTGVELRRFRRGLLPKLAVAALVLVPLLYGALYLWAFWDPTGRMERLPVALVDADRPGTLGDGTPVHAGREIVDTLLADGSLDWRTTSASDAAAGVEDGTYYFAVTIPTDFSAAVASAGGSDPEQARIDVTYNDANSFLGATLGRSAMLQVTEAVRETIGEKAVDTVLLGVGEARDGFATAADGATTLADATRLLADGASDLADGAAEARDGAQRLAVGAGRAADGADTLADGAEQAAAGAEELTAGAQQTASGSLRVDDGARTLAAGLDRAATGAASLDAGAAALATGVDTAAATITDVLGLVAGAAPALRDVAGYLSARAAAGDTAALTPLRELSGLNAAVQGIDGSATADDLAALVAGAGQVAAGAATLDSALSSLDTGARSLADGTTALTDATVQVAAGAASLRDGAAALAGGASDLASGARRVADGTAELASGTSELAGGARTVADGGGQVSDGTATLADGLADGAQQLPDDTAELRSDRAGVIASPVTLDETHLTKAEGFGEGFAPFFISLALFVGALITWLLLRPLPSRALAAPVSGLRAAFAGYWPAAAIGLAQVTVMLGVISLGVGLDLATVAGTVAFTALVGLTFIALQQMLLTVLGPAAGKVAILALLMLQLASSGGTYPVETTPAFFRVLHPLLPMSYAVSGLREVITGGIDARLWTSVTVLGAVLVGSLAATAGRAAALRTWSLTRLHPALSL